MDAQQRRNFTLTIGLAFLLCGSCSRTRKVEAHETRDASGPTVPVARAALEDLSRDLVLTAEFRPFQEIDVMAKVAGYIKEIRVDVGDRVRQGQLLAVLEIPEMADDIARAAAAVERSEAEVTRSSDELKRAQSAHQMTHLSYERLSAVAKQKPGLVAQQEIDDAQSKDLVSEAQVAAARSSMAAAREQVQVHKAELRKAKTLLEYTRVIAPFAGVITRRYADTGSMIQAGTASQTQAMPVVRLSENTLLRLILPVPESAVPTVHVGQSVEVRVPTLNRVFPGRVARFAEKISLATRTMDTEVDVPNPNFVLVPGMYAEVNLTLDHRRRTLAIPITAVDISDEPERASGGGRRKGAELGRVLVVNSDRRIEVRRVLLGLETADKVEIRSGLREGDMVIVGGRSGLEPGERVQPKMTAMASSET